MCVCVISPATGGETRSADKTQRETGIDKGLNNIQKCIYIDMEEWLLFFIDFLLFLYNNVDNNTKPL